MGVLTKKMKIEDNRRESPVVGKISIGIPAEEVVLVGPEAVGLKSRWDVKFTKQQGGVRKGAIITEAHVKALQKEGIEEIEVVRGAAPSRLDHFRVVRRPKNSAGYVYDPEIYKKYGIEEKPREMAIMVTSEELDKVIQTSMLNWDQANNCAFCRSSDGETAQRRIPDGDGYAAGMNQVECIPFFDDDRVRFHNKPVCQYRKRDTNMGKPCQYRGAIYFQILSTNEDAGLELGRLFKMETTSFPASRHWLNGLEEAKKKVGRYSFVPLKLSLVKEATTRPGGKKTEVFRTAISVDEDYLRIYQPVVDRMLDLLKSYRDRNEFIIGDASDPTDIPIEEETPEEMDKWMSEFNPDAYKQKLEKEGFPTGGEGDENDVFTASVGNSEFSLRQMELVNRAKRLPSNTFKKFYANRSQISEENIDSWSNRVDKLLKSISEEEKEANYSENGAVSEEVSQG